MLRNVNLHSADTVSITLEGADLLITIEMFRTNKVNLRNLSRQVQYQYLPGKVGGTPAPDFLPLKKKKKIKARKFDKQ